MPNVADHRRLEKTARIVQKDDQRQVATGIVLVPNEIDKQLDWARPQVIRSWAEDYMARLSAAEGEERSRLGVMHAAFPDDAQSLVENRVLDEPETVGDDQYPAGTWVIGVKYHDDRLWDLVKRGVLSGFSMGGRVTEAEAYHVDELPDDVRVPDSVDAPTDEPVHEMLQGRVREVSTVDSPAVPRATHQQLKLAAKNVEKRFHDMEDAFEFLVERGHESQDARILAALITEYANQDEEDGKMSLRERFAAWLKGEDTEKDGRTLSRANRDDLMAIHDLVERSLSRELDHSPDTYTANPHTEFTIEDALGKMASVPNGSTVTPHSSAGDKQEEDPTTMDEEELKAHLDEWATDKGLIDPDEDEEKGDEDPALAKLEERLDDHEDKFDALAKGVVENNEILTALAKQGGLSQQLKGEGDPDEGAGADKESWADLFGLPAEA